MAPNRGKGLTGEKRLYQQPSRILKRKREVEDIEALCKRVDKLESKPETAPVDFSELPLSQPTQDGLNSSHFKKLTTIQARGIPVSLKGFDVLGAAKTGSGKTLSFLIPVLENLYRRRWTEYDGVGALILSPTRELAIQIFDVLRKVGRNHTFSAGLVIGGKSLQEERDRLGRMNILVATPGRILQHMDQTADLDIGNLQMLILDEADRIMDMGFKSTVDAIVEHLPKSRQTLMFSATQTKKVSDLARLSLTEPEFVSVHEAAISATPTTLQQNYVVTPLPQKLDTLWSFIRANIKKKILVFLSSGKQVRFVYEAFRHLQPGLPLLHLHGRQKQTARLDITAKFSNSKYACLFSTDIAARGLDFPSVDWVVQVDCPEDADTYIHRVGRTARYEHEGHAVLFLDPSEKGGMLAALERKRVVGVEEIHVRQKKMQNTIKNQLQNMCFKDPELKYLGQKAFVSYVRSVYMQKDRDIFDIKKLDLEAFAASLGLPGAPRVKFVKGEDAKTRKNMPRALVAMEDEQDTSESADENGNMKEKKRDDKPVVRTKYDRMFERRNQDVLAEHYQKLIQDDDEPDRAISRNGHTADADSDEDFMAVKHRYQVGDEALGAVSHISRSQSDSGSDSDDSQSATVESGRPQHTILSTSTLPPTTTAKQITLSSHPSAQPLIIDSNRRARALQSRKALLKYKGAPTHLVFSDDENDNTGHAKVVYEKEDDFKKRGAADVQREEFLEKEKERVKRADDIDREVARDKRRERKIKRKERERELAAGDLEDEGDDDSGGFGGERGVQLAPWTGDAAGNVHVPIDLGFDDDDDDDDEEAGANGDDDEKRQGRSSPPRKRQKKWFEDDTDGEDDDEEEGSSGVGVKHKNDDNKKKKTTTNKKNGRSKSSPHGDVREPQTLEDLEAMATGLLAS